jgi:hypothetical protein
MATLLPSLSSEDEGPVDGDGISDSEDEMEQSFEFGGILVRSASSYWLEMLMKASSVFFLIPHTQSSSSSSRREKMVGCSV